jgi:Mg2+-importing ATPase
VDKKSAASLSVDAALAALASSLEGISRPEAVSRLARYGPNTLTRERVTALRVLLRQFQSALIYFLIVAAGLSFATGDVSDGAIITVILLLNAALGFSQEYRSERAVEKLAQLISDQVSVSREGVTVLVDAADLVPGDVVLLKEGDVVPADLKLLAAEACQVDESQLTGESASVTKASSSVGGDGLASLLFAGSALDRGTATGLVYATANDTELGQIAGLSAGISKVTQYEQSLRAFSTLLMKIIGVSLALTFVAKIALNGGAGNVSSLAIFLIVLAVAVVPEALPAIATLTLARGALRLARERVVVKRLSSLEDLGNVTLLCTDKTGTLTENKQTIQHLTSPDPHLFQLLAYACIDRTAVQQRGTQASFDAAFAAFVSEDVKAQAAGFAIVSDIPFDPAARRRHVVVREPETGRTYLVVIGSAETLLEIARCQGEPANAQDMYREQVATEGAEGLRHLALAYRELDPAHVTTAGSMVDQEQSLTFLGFVTLVDPVRASVPRTLETAQRLGVAVKILTGDSEEVAGYVGHEVGLVPAGAHVYTGNELAGMTPGDLARAVSEGSVFARVSPDQKFNIIRALKGRDVVAYEGDGINDAPPLKLADVGIAVDSATDVARANADIILLDKDLGVIVNAIKEGRTIFANINKYIKYTMVGNFGNFFALAVLYLLSNDLPLLPRQILLVSLLTDLPLVAISTDAVASAELERPDRYSASSLLAISAALGSLTALFELAFFATLRGQALVAKQTSLYLFLALTQLIVIVSIRNREHFWRAVRPSSALAAAIMITAVMSVAVPYVPPLRDLFSFERPSVAEVGIVLAAVLVYVLALDVAKVWYYRLARRQDHLRHGGRASPNPAVPG